MKRLARFLCLCCLSVLLQSRSFADTQQALIFTRSPSTKSTADEKNNLTLDSKNSKKNTDSEAVPISDLIEALEIASGYKAELERKILTVNRLNADLDALQRRCDGLAFQRNVLIGVCVGCAIVCTANFIIRRKP